MGFNYTISNVVLKSANTHALEGKEKIKFKLHLNQSKRIHKETSFLVSITNNTKMLTILSVFHTLVTKSRTMNRSLNGIKS